MNEHQPIISAILDGWGKYHNGEVLLQWVTQDSKFDVEEIPHLV